MEELQINEPTSPESQEYINEMVAKAESQDVVSDPSLEHAVPADNTTEPQRPDWLPEKFKSAEDMAKSYQELEARLGNQNQEQATPTQNENPQPGMFSESELQKYGNELLENGEFGETTIAEFEKKGLSRDVIQDFQAGKKAQQELLRRDVVDSVGGQDEYTKMSNWAKANLSETELDTFNRNVGLDKDQSMFAVQALHARYRNANGVAPKLAKAGGRPGASGFQSWAQVSKAMGDERYKSDPAYRQKVESLLANSNLDA